MKFGAHVSIAGGVQNAPLNAAALGCEVFQMFSRSPRGGQAPKLTADVLELFLKNCAANNFKDWVIHAPYYLNFASAEERTRQASIRILREELERSSLLKAKYLMFHPGSALGLGPVEAIKQCVTGIKKVLADYAGETRLLIEISAGAGLIIGDQFEEIAEILTGVGHPEFGVCFDTAHAFASGYDLRTPAALNATLKKFDDLIGLKKLKMSHCNDSKVELGMKRDRHEHLGKGFIGLAGFRALVKHKRLQAINLILETEPDGVEKDLTVLKNFRG